MKVLLVTHAFLWWITDDPQLSARAREVISDGENELFLSAASGWEIAIKAKLKRLKLPGEVERFIGEQLALNAIQSLSVKMSHALHVYTIPDHHRDPFDRLLAAQVKMENLHFLTADKQMSKYGIKVIW